MCKNCECGDSSPIKPTTIMDLADQYKAEHNIIPTKKFEKVHPILEFVIKGDEEIPDGQRITVCHYPMIVWNHSHRGSWQLFGHVHSREDNNNPEAGRLSCLTPNQYDIGVDRNNFKPVSYEEIKTIITKQNLR